MSDHPTRLSIFPANRAALPEPVVHAVFQRLATMYGDRWLAKWIGVPLDEVKRAWGDALAGVTQDQLLKALDALESEHPPSLPEFRALCRKYRTQGEHTAELLSLPRQRVGPEVFQRLHAILAAGRPVDDEAAAPKV